MENPHTHDLTDWRHEHVFDPGNAGGERGAWRVVALTVAMMAVELAAGWWYHSMALLADGWHMATHAVALGLTASAYGLARRWSRDPSFAFGSWKVEILASFSSALLLLVVAVLLAAESVSRFVAPLTIGYGEALVVASAGLAVNLLSAWLLSDGQAGHHHDHAQGHSHGTAHGHHHPDLNLRSAYIHVLTDALTSVLAIVALAAGLLWGWAWLDPAMGLAGSAVIAYWAIGLLRDSARVLLDREMDHPLVEWTRAAIESDGDARVADLHLWRVGRNQFSCAVCLVADAPFPPATYRDRLRSNTALVHVTVEVNACTAPAGREP